MSKKERPILFSAPMVQAILAGNKTQTRRVVPEKLVDAYYEYDDYCNSVMPYEKEYFLNRCPYGAVGERLWVRETFRLWDTGMCGCGEYCTCPPDGTPVYRATVNPEQEASVDEAYSPWRPSIFMPRAICRILLEITEVRVERLQAISEADAIAEGLVSYPHEWRSMSHPMPNRAYEPYRDSPERFSCPVQAYQALWDSINGKRQGLAWADNPWVWAVSFKAVPHD